MGVLREKMIEEMKLRDFASRTQKSYLAVMVGLAKHYRQFPDQLTQPQWSLQNRPMVVRSKPANG
jgi:hypothetical protein